MEIDASQVIRDEAELGALYPPALERSVRKQMDHLDDHCRAFIAASPMVIVGTQSGMADNSPRGDVPGFVKVADDHTLLIPDRRGNNRLDSLRNLVKNPVVGLLFLIPGVNESFRVNGEAVISRDPALTEQFVMQGQAPRTVIVVKVKEAYIQCSRALVRSDLWNPAKHVERRSLPSSGTILADITRGRVGGAEYDAAYPERLKATIY